jgi:hypothetical protein
VNATDTLRRIDSPLAPLAVALPVATLFVVARWLDAAHRQLGQFVVAGSLYVSRARTPPNLPVGPGSGYDGQFYYRLALNPFDLARSAFGIRFDSYSRVERIGYPFLAWLVARGHHASVPLALVIVNVLACALLALAGGLVAKSVGRHALWGLIFAGYWGYLWTMGRDLSELTTAALVMLGFAALLRQAPIWSGIAFLGAVLSKETAVLLVGTIAVVTLWRRVAGHEGGPASIIGPAPPIGPGLGRALTPRRSDLAFLLPLIGFVVWQLVLEAATGHLPIYKSGGENLGVPFVGMAHGISHYLSIFPTIASALWIGEFVALVLLALAAGLSFRQSPLEFRALWIVSVVLGLSAATGIWLGDVGFRSLDDVFLLSCVLLLYRSRPSWPLAVLGGGMWCAVAVELVKYL